MVLVHLSIQGVKTIVISNLLEPSKCPICGDLNQCAQEIAKATGKSSETCWCMTATFSAELLDRVPKEAQNKACIYISPV
jgi:hypothetical protein